MLLSGGSGKQEQKGEEKAELEYFLF